MTGVFIIAPSAAVRAGLRALMLDDANMRVCGEAASLNFVDGEIEPDVVIWSPAAGTGQELNLSEIIGYVESKAAALLLMHDDPKMIEKLTRSNLPSWGLISTESSQAEIIVAVNALNEGLIVANLPAIKQLASTRVFRRDEEAGMIEPLTGREIDILQLLAQGLPNKQIALQLGISTHTVKFHLSSIFNKMGTTNRTETVKLGLRMGLIAL